MADNPAVERDPERVDALWRDPAHWRCGGVVYVCPTDARLFVPKQVWWMGFTLNFGHSWSVPTMCALVAVPAAIAVGVRESGRRR